MINSIAKKIIKKFDINKFIETGILNGETLSIVVSWFCEMYPTEFNVYAGASTYSKYKMYEVDIDPLAIERAKNITKGMNNIIIDCDDSSQFINNLYSKKELTDKDNCMFYLDAHPHRSSKEEMLKPLLCEINEICKHNNKTNNEVIISVDDWKVEGKRNDWYSEEDIKDIVCDKTNIIWHTKYPNINKKYSCFIFLNKFFNTQEHIDFMKDNFDIIPVKI